MKFGNKKTGIASCQKSEVRKYFRSYARILIVVLRYTAQGHNNIAVPDAECQHYIPKRKIPKKTCTLDEVARQAKEAGMTNQGVWDSGENVMKWWIGDDPNQIHLFDVYDEEQLML